MVKSKTDVTRRRNFWRYMYLSSFHVPRRASR